MTDSSAQYDALARFNLALGRLQGGLKPSSLSMHKRLKPHAEAGHAHEVPKQQKKRASAMTTDQWLAAKIVAEQPASVADIGCGFGLTAALIAQQCHARVYGLNASKVATEAGQRFWQEAQLDNPPALQQGRFGDPLPTTDLDIMLSIEALGYSDDLEQSLEWLWHGLKAGGSLMILDDYLRPSALSNTAPSGPSNTPSNASSNTASNAALNTPPNAPYKASFSSSDAQSLSDTDALCHYWQRARLWSLQELLDTAHKLGFVSAEQIDLTPRVFATSESPSRLWRHVLRLGARVNGDAGHIARAFLGGWHLDSLYNSGNAEYHFVRLQKPEGVKP